MKRQMMAATMGVMAAFGAPEKAQAYDIDCAIMLCMAGGFPEHCLRARLSHHDPPHHALAKPAALWGLHLRACAGRTGWAGWTGRARHQLAGIRMAEPDPCDLVHRALLRAARRTTSVGLVDPLLRSREPHLPLHPAGLRVPHARPRHSSRKAVRRSPTRPAVAYGIFMPAASWSNTETMRATWAIRSGSLTDPRCLAA